VIREIVLDIEGTTSSTEFVKTTLFPYSRAHFASYIAAHRDSPELARVLDDVREQSGESDVVTALQRWVDEDAKVTPLKTMQGWIWRDAFTRGELVAHFYPDVVPALERWRAAGIALAVYSSGSVDAQRAWFGDVGRFVRANFDTENAGPKREVESYRAIAKARDRDPTELLFLSDARAELDAARAAGWHTIGVRRPGEPASGDGVGDHHEVASFAEINLQDWQPR